MNATIGTTLKGRYQIIADLKRRAFGKTYRAIRLAPGEPRSSGVGDFWSGGSVGSVGSVGSNLPPLPTPPRPPVPPSPLECAVQIFQPPSSHPLIWESAKQRFEQELSIQTRLGEHPQIPSIIEGFQENQELCVVREYIPGQSLEPEMKQPWSPDRVITMLQEVLTILDFAHQCGVIHGNITPTNLIRRSWDSKIVLIDFARIKEIETIVLSPEGVAKTSAVGTPGYMPIEQLHGKPAYGSDIYALGITAIQALTGVSPRQLEREPKTGQVIWHHLAPVSEDLMAILDQMVCADISGRYQSAAAVLHDLAGLDKINRVLHGHYQIIDVLFLSPLGTTFLARDMQRADYPFYAIKEIQPSLVVEDASVNRLMAAFDEVAQVLSTLGNHPSIPHLVDDFAEGGCFYLVQEFIEGESALVPGARWDEAQARQFLVEALKLLDHLHQHHCYCLALDPSCLRRRHSDGNIVLADFSFVKTPAEALDAGVWLLPGYMPARAREGVLRPNSDIYALGMLVIQGLTGIHPGMLPRDNSSRLLWRAQTQVSDQLGAILDKMVLPYFRDRYQSAQEVLADISRPGRPGDGGSVGSVGRVGSVGSNLPPSPPPLPTPPPLPPLPTPPRLRVPPSPRLRVPASVRKTSFIVLGVVCLAVAGMAALAGMQKWQRFHAADKYIEEANSFLDERLGSSALGKCDWAISIASDYAEAWKCHGDALYILERYKAALVSYQKAVALEPKNPKYWNNQGETLYQMGDYAAAIAAHDRALAADKRNSAARKGRGLALIGLNRYSDAVAEFDQAIALDPSDPKSWENKGLALEYLSNPTSAREAYQEAIAVYDGKLAAQPKSPTMWVERGRVLSKLQRSSEALASYDKALEINPQFYLAWNAKGSTLYSMGEFDAAVAAYDQALEINPEFYTAWHNRGAVLNAGLGRYEEAISSYEKVLEINPSFYHAWRDKGAALAAMSRYKDAIEAFDKALKIEPNDHKSWVSRGLALTELARDEEALASFDKAITIYPLDAFAWMRRGVVLEYLQRNEDALASYDKAVEIQPKFQPAIEARSRLRSRLSR
ncbi:MAG TPA: tetratricopeptide repeat protein [Oscillatoriaceae cyanobacterium M33_DOE_052]|nr:tetratricopeptide repeat protein [Oscillatoriaceae cyanobacterium M33_DOE_052]